MAIEFTVEEAQERLPELLDRVESGEEIVITRFGGASAALKPVRGGASGGVIAGGVLAGAWFTPVAGGVSGEDSTFDVGTDYGMDLPG